VEVVAALSQGRTAAAQCGLFTHKSVPVIFEPPCINTYHLPLNAYGSVFRFYMILSDNKQRLFLCAASVVWSL